MSGVAHRSEYAVEREIPAKSLLRMMVALQTGNVCLLSVRGLYGLGCATIGLWQVQDADDDGSPFSRASSSSSSGPLQLCSSRPSEAIRFRWLWCWSGFAPRRDQVARMPRQLASTPTGLWGPSQVGQDRCAWHVAFRSPPRYS